MHLLEAVDDLLGVLRTARGAEEGAAVDRDVAHRLRGELDDVVAVGGDEAAVAVAEPDHPAHAVVVGQGADQAGDDVVQTRAQSAAGDDPGAGLRRVEVDLPAGPARLQPRQLLRFDAPGADPGGGVVEQDPVAGVDVVLGGAAGVEQRRQR
nr:hypothetical protein [Pseudonocardia sp. ICBG601]